MHFVISKHTTIQRASRWYDTGIKTDIQINETEQSQGKKKKKKNLCVYGQMILNKSVHNRKKIVPSTTVLEKLDIHVTTCKRTKLDLYLILYTELTKNS